MERLLRQEVVKCSFIGFAISRLKPRISHHQQFFKKDVDRKRDDLCIVVKKLSVLRTHCIQTTAKLLTKSGTRLCRRKACRQLHNTALIFKKRREAEDDCGNAFIAFALRLHTSVLTINGMKKIRCCTAEKLCGRGRIGQTRPNRESAGKCLLRRVCLHHVVGIFLSHRDRMNCEMKVAAVSQRTAGSRIIW